MNWDFKNWSIFLAICFAKITSWIFTVLINIACIIWRNRIGWSLWSSSAMLKFVFSERKTKIWHKFDNQIKFVKLFYCTVNLYPKMYILYDVIITCTIYVQQNIFIATLVHVFIFYTNNVIVLSSVRNKFRK